MADEEDFLEQVEDVLPEVPEGGATNIFEMAGGQRVTRTANATGIPLGPVDPTGGLGSINPRDITTPRRKIAGRQKPWMGAGDYGSIYNPSRGSAMSAMDFNQTPAPKEEILEKKAGPIDQRVKEINEGPTGQGFVGKVKTPKLLSARDEEDPNMTENTMPEKEPSEIARIATWSQKVAKIQVIGQKDGAMLMTFAEFKQAGKGSTEKEYGSYLQSRCYACAEPVEGGLMCHECYAAAHETPIVGTKKSAKELVIDILKEAKKPASSKDLIIPRKASKTEKFDWDKNRSAEPADGHRSTKGTGEKEYKLQDADFYAEQNAAIGTDAAVKREDFTLTRGKEKVVKPDAETLERYAAKGGQAALDKEIKVEIEPIKKDEPVILQRPSSTKEGFPVARRSMTDERLVDYDSAKGQDYVTEYNFKGAELVKKDYPYQLMKQQGASASTTGIPQVASSSFSSTLRGVPFVNGREGVAVSASGKGVTLADKFASSSAKQGWKVGEIVRVADTDGNFEIMDYSYGNDGLPNGVVLQGEEGTLTVSAKLLRKAIGEPPVEGEVVEHVDQPGKRLTVKKMVPGGEMTVEPETGGEKKNIAPDAVPLKIRPVQAQYKVANNPRIAEHLRGKVGYKDEKGALVLAEGRYMFKPEDLIQVK